MIQVKTLELDWEDDWIFCGFELFLRNQNVAKFTKKPYLNTLKDVKNEFCNSLGI